jgi:hypothetical protein
MKRVNNYDLQVQQAKGRFLTYDQQELISRCRLKYDEAYFYIRFLGSPYRICRKTGNMQRQSSRGWVDGNSFAEVMTILDWLCDSRPDRYVTGRFANVVTQNPNFHRNLQEDREDPDATLFSSHPEAFCEACQALGGIQMSGADLSYAIELVDGLQVLVQLWHGDEEFPARLCLKWDENVTRYIRYETTWYAAGLVISRLREQIG